MIIGVGTDMIEIERVRKACGKQAFFTRCFSVREQEMISRQFCSQRGCGESIWNRIFRISSWRYRGIEG